MDRLPFFQRPLRFAYYNVTIVLIIVNAGVFALTYFIVPTLFSYLAMTPALVILRNWWFQVFTYMFMHASFFHLLSRRTNAVGSSSSLAMISRSVSASGGVLM